MGHHYPITLNIAGKKAVVVGGGKIAYRRLTRLVEADAEVLVISPHVSNEIKELNEAGKIRWKKKQFEEDDLCGALIVIAATNDIEVNRFVAASVYEHQLLNIVDDQFASNFHVPAIVRRGDLQISVSTGGASPTLATNIRNEIAELYGEEYEAYLQFLKDARNRIKQLSISNEEKNRFLKEITKQEYRHSHENRSNFFNLID